MRNTNFGKLHYEILEFLDMYPDAEIPEEFALVLPSGINDVDEIKRAEWHGVLDFMLSIPKDLILSLLLTIK